MPLAVSVSLCIFFFFNFLLVFTCCFWPNGKWNHVSGLLIALQQHRESQLEGKLEEKWDFAVFVSCETEESPNDLLCLSLCRSFSDCGMIQTRRQKVKKRLIPIGSVS